MTLARNENYTWRQAAAAELIIIVCEYNESLSAYMKILQLKAKPTDKTTTVSLTQWKFSYICNAMEKFTLINYDSLKHSEKMWRMRKKEGAERKRFSLAKWKNAIATRSRFVWMFKKRKRNNSLQLLVLLIKFYLYSICLYVFHERSKK